MELIEKIVIKKTNQYNQVKELFKNSFPKNELAPMWILTLLSKKSNIEFIAYYENEILIGSTYLIFNEKMIYLVYLAVNNNLRSKGYGTRILERLKNKYKNKAIVLNTETPEIWNTNYEQRVKREEFYIKNNFINTGLYMKEMKTKFNFMSFGEFDKNELKKLFKSLSFNLYSPKIYKHM